MNGTKSPRLVYAALLLVVIVFLTIAQPQKDAYREQTHSDSNFPVGRVVLASGAAIETEEDAEVAAVAEIPESVNPDNPVARLMTAIDVGMWLGSCSAWATERPHWLVGVETDSAPDYFGSDIPVTPAVDFAGMYIVLDANDGELKAFGGLSSTEYDDIENMTSKSLSISYETSLPAITGVATNVAGPNATQRIATVIAVPTREAECQALHW